MPSPTPTPTPTPTGAVRPTPTPTPTLAPGGFRHPGVLVNRAQLDFVKLRIAARGRRGALEGGLRQGADVYNHYNGRSSLRGRGLAGGLAPASAMDCIERQTSASSNGRCAPARPPRTIPHLVKGDSMNRTLLVGALLALAAPSQAQFSGYYRLTARHSGKAVAVQGASTANAADVIQWTYGGTATNDEWQLVDLGTGYHRIVNRNSGKVLNVAGASTASGANVDQWSWASANQQQWQVVDLGNGYHRLTARHSGKVLNVAGASTADGANVDQWSWSNVNQQMFAIVSVGSATPPTPTPTGAVRPTPTRTPTPTPRPGAFRHPGVLLNRAQLDLLKARVAAGTQPTLDAYNRARTDALGSLSYVPHPWQTVECGAYSTPNLGCSDESKDSRAAYTHALLWHITGNTAHAQKSVEIMNAWARTLTGGHTNHNAPLQAAWYGSVWPRAAEIIRYTYTGWASADVDRFKTMLRTQYLPSFINGSCANGNWEASMAEATVNIGVFLDDKAVYDKGVSLWRGRVKAYFYLTSDGALPLPPSHCNRPSWYGETTFVDGLCQETCRDYGHMSGGFAGLVNAAETAYQQGLDLYGEESLRLRKAMEFHTQYLNGVAVPSWLCDGSLDLQVGGTWEIGYNHYALRKGYSLPHTLAVLQANRPMGASAHKVWETLSHAGVGNAGLP